MLHVGPTWGVKDEKDGKTFIRLYTIASKLLDEYICQLCFIIFLKLKFNKNVTPLSEKFEEKQ